MGKYVLVHISLILRFLEGIFEFWGVFFNFLGSFGFFKNCNIIVNLLLGPVVNLGRGYNCGEK